VSSLEKPQPTRREVYIEPNQWKEMLKLATDQEEMDFLQTMRETGMRPQEIRIIEAKHYRNGCVTFPIKDSKGKQRSRVVYLNDTARQIIERLCEKHPTGVIFRNGKGNPWNRNSIRLRFKKFKKHLGIPDLCSTAIRHVFTTEALKNEVNPVALAELLGHTSTSMISRHYSHLFQNPEYLKAQATKATRLDASTEHSE